MIFQQIYKHLLMPETQDLHKCITFEKCLHDHDCIGFSQSYNEPYRTSLNKVSLHTQTYPYYYHPTYNHMELHSLYSYC